MNLSLSDIQRLYGKQLFVIGESKTPEIHSTSTDALPSVKHSHTPATVVAEALPFQSGDPVAWKLKPGSTLSLVLSSSDFDNRTWTGWLKQCIVQAGVPLDKVGFGVYADTAQEVSLQDMSTSVGVLFGKYPSALASPASWDGKFLFGADSLSSLQDTRKQQEVTLMLKQCLHLMK